MRCDCHSHNGFLTEKGYAFLAQRELELGEVDFMPHSGYLDKSGSVSALVEVEDDFEYDPDHVELNRRLIHSGS